MIRRIIAQPTKILDKARGAYWRGERCETIVAQRIAQRAAEKAARRSNRRRAGATERTGDPSKRRPRSLKAQLGRLERALTRRKTEAGKQSVRARITQLQREIASA